PGLLARAAVKCVPLVRVALLVHFGRVGLSGNYKRGESNRNADTKHCRSLSGGRTAWSSRRQRFSDETALRLLSGVIAWDTAPYTGAALTVGGELNKLASNIALGRDAAGVHYRS